MNEVEMDPVTALRNLGAAAASISTTREKHKILVFSENTLAAFIEEHSKCKTEKDNGTAATRKPPSTSAAAVEAFKKKRLG